MSVEINALQVANATNMVSTLSMPDCIPTEQAFIEFCQSVYAKMTAHEDFTLLDLSRSEEFRSFAYAGIPNGEVIAPAILGAHSIFEFLKEMTGATNVFWHAVVSGTIFASHLFDNVYVLNDTTTLIMANEAATSGIENVIPVPRSTLSETLPPLDLSAVLISSVVGDYDILDIIIDKLKPKGILVIGNSSLGGSMYDVLDGLTLEQTEDISIPSFVHKKIIDRGDVLTYHVQGWISYTVCVKR